MRARGHRNKGKRRTAQTGARATTPHDQLFKAVFSNPRHAAGEIRYLLPSALVRALDWKTLRLEPGSFVDRRLRSSATDLLFSVRLQASTDRLGLYLLMEHQSTPDPLMPLRMQRYVASAQLSLATERQHPPVVLPIVVSNADGEWPHPLDAHSLFRRDLDTFPELRPHIAQLSILLDDLPATSVEQILRRRLTRVGLLTLCWMRDARSYPRFSKAWPLWLNELRHLHTRERAAFLLLIEYFMALHPEMTRERLRDRIHAEAPEMEETFVSAAEEWFARGRAEGEAKGRAEGEAKGRERVLRELLEQRFGPLPRWAVQRLRKADARALDELSSRILAATSLRDAFG
ncbi:MAG: Rpn family recombination-promoting nuclease/putative transposase [Polyangiaceae bacterium]